MRIRSTRYKVLSWILAIAFVFTSVPAFSIREAEAADTAGSFTSINDLKGYKENGDKYQLVTFGQYPKVLVTDEDEIKKIDEAYKNNSYRDVDFEINGQWYRRISVNSENKYFQFMPVWWKVLEKNLENNTVTLMSNSILDEDQARWNPVNIINNEEWMLGVRYPSIKNSLFPGEKDTSSSDSNDNSSITKAFSLSILSYEDCNNENYGLLKTEGSPAVQNLKNRIVGATDYAKAINGFNSKDEMLGYWISTNGNNSYGYVGKKDGKIVTNPDSKSLNVGIVLKAVVTIPAGSAEGGSETAETDPLNKIIPVPSGQTQEPNSETVSIDGGGSSGDGSDVPDEPVIKPLSDVSSVDANGAWSVNEGADGFDAETLVIPSQVGGSKVTKLTSDSFKNLTAASKAAVTKVFLPEGLTEIGDGTFSGFNSITEISIPKTVTAIGSKGGNGAFAGMDGLKQVHFEYGSELASLGDNTFKDDKNLTLVGENTAEDAPTFNLPSKLSSIGKDAFNGTKAETVGIPSGLKTAESAFAGSNLKNVTIPGSVSAVSKEMFSGCKSLEAVSILPGVEEIREGAFKDCTSLKSISIPSSVKTISKDAFKGCTGLTSIYLPNKDIKIDNSAFPENIQNVYTPGGEKINGVADGKVQDISKVEKLVLNPEKDTVSFNANEKDQNISYTAYANGTGFSYIWEISKDKDFTDPLVIAATTGSSVNTSNIIAVANRTINDKKVTFTLTLLKDRQSGISDYKFIRLKAYNPLETVGGPISLDINTSTKLFVTFHGGYPGQPSVAEEKKSGDIITFADPDYIPDGKKFLGWSETKGSTAAQYTVGQTYTVESSVDFYPVYSDKSGNGGGSNPGNPGNTGTGSGNTGKTVSTKASVTYREPATTVSVKVVSGSTIKLNKPVADTYNGKKFTGWSTNSAVAASWSTTLTDGILKADASYKVNKDITFYAVYNDPVVQPFVVDKNISVTAFKTKGMFKKSKGFKYVQAVRLKYSFSSNAAGVRILRSAKKKKGYKVIKTVTFSDPNGLASGTYFDKKIKLGKKYYYQIMPLDETGAPIKTAKSARKAGVVKKLMKPSASIRMQNNALVVTFKKAAGQNFETQFRLAGTNTWTSLPASTKMAGRLKGKVTSIKLTATGFYYRVRTSVKSGKKTYRSAWTTFKNKI